jgi:hypothetical protein
MSQSFTPQIGWKYFGNINNNIYFEKLTKLLQEENYNDAIEYTVRNPDIINKPNTFGWTPLMALITNVQNINCIPYIKQVIGFVNLKQINLNDDNYLLIAIKHCHPEFLYEVYKILVENNINVHYQSQNGTNALDLSIDMFKFTVGKKCDIKYFNIAFDLKEKRNVQSIKHDIINHIEFPISPWLIENLENNNDYYNVIYDPDIVSLNSTTSNLVPSSYIYLTYEKEDLTPENIKTRKEAIDILNLMSDEELLVKLKMSLGKDINSNDNIDYQIESQTKNSKKHIPFLNSSFNELNKKDPIKNFEKPETYITPNCNSTNYSKKKKKDKKGKEANQQFKPSQNIIVFDKFMTQNKFSASCIRCGTYFTDKNFAAIFKPCDHTVMCKTYIINLNNKRSIDNCPKCYTIIYYAVLN